MGSIISRDELVTAVGKSIVWGIETIGIEFPT